MGVAYLSHKPPTGLRLILKGIDEFALRAAPKIAENSAGMDSNQFQEHLTRIN